MEAPFGVPQGHYGSKRCTRNKTPIAGNGHAGEDHRTFDPACVGSIPTTSIPKTQMIRETTAPCAECGDPVDVEIDVDGETVDAGCYTSLFVVEEKDCYDDARVDQYFDEDPTPGTAIVIYTECKDCCPDCSGH